MISTSTSSMQAMAISGHRLQAVLLPTPQPQAQEVQIRVAYVGVNRADAMQLAGNYPPPEGASPLPGLEVSGTISALGSGVTDWHVGDNVCALLNGGGYAEAVTVPATQCLPIPQNLTSREAASLPEAAATSFMALGQIAQMKRGECLLLHGGTSGVGIIMAQVALAWGADVFATAGNDEKCAALQKLGVHPINHHTAPFGAQVMAATNGEGIDVIVDILGAPQLVTHLKLLRRGGRLVNLAMLEGAVADSVKLSPILLKHLQVTGATLRSRTDTEKAAIIHGVRETIWPHVASDTIKPFVDSVFPLTEAEKALLHMQERLHIGKILLEVR